MHSHLPHPSAHALYGFRTASVTLCGEARAMEVAIRLVSASQWFSVLPLPDDHWEITVKKENESHLQTWCVPF